jgi:hypothetical protein
LGWIGPSDALHAGLIAFIFAPLLQVIACVFGFLSRDVVAATGIGVLAGTSAAIGAVSVTSRAGTTSHALGTLLLVAAAAVLVSATVAAAAKLVPAIVMGLAAARFVVTGIYEFVPDSGWKTASGIVSLVAALAALYGMASLEIESIRGAPILPTLRRGAGLRAFPGTCRPRSAMWRRKPECAGSSDAQSGAGSSPVRFCRPDSLNSRGDPASTGTEPTRRPAFSAD